MNRSIRAWCNRAFRSRNVQRTFTGGVALIELWNLIGADSPWEAALWGVAVLIFVGAQLLLESRHRAYDQWRRSDPRYDPEMQRRVDAYRDRLSGREQAQIMEWMADHLNDWPGPLDDAPPVVRDYFQLVHGHGAAS